MHRGLKATVIRKQCNHDSQKEKKSINCENQTYAAKLRMPVFVSSVPSSGRPLTACSSYSPHICIHQWSPGRWRRAGRDWTSTHQAGPHSSSRCSPGGTGSDASCPRWYRRRSAGTSGQRAPLRNPVEEGTSRNSTQHVRVSWTNLSWLTHYILFLSSSQPSGSVLC